jgi:hypothetical protein
MSVSNVIDFLERFGRDAELRHASGEEVEAALRLAGIEPVVRMAIVDKDQGALEKLLGADTNVCCLINKPDEEEEGDEEELEEDDEHEEGDDEEKVKSLQGVVERVA